MALAQGASGDRLLEQCWEPSGPAHGKVRELALRHQAARALTYAALRKATAGEDALAEVAMAKLITSHSAFEAADALYTRVPATRGPNGRCVICG